MSAELHPQARAERVAANAYARAYCADLAALLRKRRISALEARILRRRINAFADGLEAGLHVTPGEEASAPEAMATAANAPHAPTGSSGGGNG